MNPRWTTTQANHKKQGTIERLLLVPMPHLHLCLHDLGPVLLTLVASDSSRKPAFATLSVLLTCRDAVARSDVAGNCCVSSPAGAGVCRSRKHGSCEPTDMLFHLQKLSQRHRDFRLLRVHVENMTVEEPLGNFPVNWSAAHGLRRRYLAFPAWRSQPSPVLGMPPPPP